MISIYRCDDEESVRHQLKTVLEWKIFMEDCDMGGCAASTARELLDTAQGSRLDFVGSLNELEKELNGRFVRVNQSFLAAWDKIVTVDGTGNQVRIGGRMCLLSRTGKAELKKRWRGSF